MCSGKRELSDIAVPLFHKKYFGLGWTAPLYWERVETFNYAWVYKSIRTRGGVALLVGRGAVDAGLVLVPVARLLVQAGPPVSITAVFACTCANVSSISEEEQTLNLIFRLCQIENSENIFVATMQQSRMSTTHHLNITGKIKYRNLFLHVYAFWQHKSTKSGNSVLINKIMLRGTSL